MEAATATLVWSLISAIAVSCPTVRVTVADSSSPSSTTTTTIMRYIIRHGKETGSQHPCIKPSPTQRENLSLPHLIASQRESCFLSSQKHLAIIVMVCIFWTLIDHFNGPSSSCKIKSSWDRAIKRAYLTLPGLLICSVPPVCAIKFRIFLPISSQKFVTFRYIYRIEMMLYYYNSCSRERPAL